MCNRHRMSAKPEELALRFGIDPSSTAAWGFGTKIRAGGRMLDEKVPAVRSLTAPFWRSSLNAPALR